MPQPVGGIMIPPYTASKILLILQAGDTGQIVEISVT